MLCKLHVFVCLCVCVCVMWQLLYVWNALALIAVPLGGKRGTPQMGYRGESGERDRKRDAGEATREEAIFQAIYGNHHSVINQAFHHKTRHKARRCRCACVCVCAYVWVHTCVCVVCMCDVCTFYIIHSVNLNRHNCSFWSHLYFLHYFSLYRKCV